MRARHYLCALADKKSGMMFYIADYYYLYVCVWLCVCVRLLACNVGR